MNPDNQKPFQNKIHVVVFKIDFFKLQELYHEKS